MQFIFSIISLLIIALFAVWWTTRDMSGVTPVIQEQQPGVEQKTILDAVDSARVAKDTLEHKSPLVIDLSEQNLTSVPGYVFDRIDLESLDLSNNNLTGALPGEIRKLQSLKVLNLSGNKFTGVPAEIGQLQNLEVLNLSNNLLIGLPYELGNLQNLKLLKLTGNHYSEPDLAIIKAKLPSFTIIER